MTDPVRVIAGSIFLRALKRLRKKYPHIEQDIRPFTEKLERGETPGDRLENMGQFIVYKERLPNRDAQRGTRGGYRVIYYIRKADAIILVYLYSKSEQENVTAAQIADWIALAEAQLEQENQNQHQEPPST
jgi:mRNA-degrading endonuclease RelE of RelBE toxin-antitoxin system